MQIHSKERKNNIQCAFFVFDVRKSERCIERTVFHSSSAAIHAEAPEFVEMSVEQEILETGIKVVDMLAPYAKGGKIGKCRHIILMFTSPKCLMEAKKPGDRNMKLVFSKKG